MARDLHDEAVALHARAEAALEGGALAEAARLADRAHAGLIRAVGAEHPDVATVLLCRARVAQGRNRPDAARADATRAVALLERVARLRLDADTRRAIAALRLEALLQAGELLRDQARYDEAEPLLVRALRLARRAGAGLRARAANALGMLCKYTGQHARGRRLYRSALALVEKSRGAWLERATLCHNLGGLEHAAGRFAAAEPWARRSVALRLRGGGDGLALAADRAALAAILAELDGPRQDEAAQLYREVLAIYRRQLGPAHYEVAVTLHNQAGLAATRGRIAEAARLYRQSLALKRRLFGARHPDTGLTAHNLARVEAARGERAQAAPLLAEARAAFRARLPAGHPWRVRAADPL